MPKLTNKQILKLKKELVKRTSNQTAFALDMAHIGNEIEIINLKYGKLAVKLLIDSAYNAWDIKDLEEEFEEDFKHV